MRLFLSVSFLLLSTHVLHIIMALIAQSHWLFISTLISVFVHFVAIAGIRYGDREWFLYTSLFIAVHIILVVLTLSSGGGHILHAATLCPPILNTFFMMQRRPRWEAIFVEST